MKFWTNGIIVGIAIAIICYALFKVVLKLIAKLMIRHEIKEWNKLMQDNVSTTTINVKDVLSRHFDGLLKERNRILEEQKKAK